MNIYCKSSSHSGLKFYRKYIIKSGKRKRYAPFHKFVMYKGKEVELHVCDRDDLEGVESAYNGQPIPKPAGIEVFTKTCEKAVDELSELMLANSNQCYSIVKEIASRYSQHKGIILSRKVALSILKANLDMIYDRLFYQAAA